MKNDDNKMKATSPDLPESKRDREHLQAEETIIYLPDVDDIPGQQYVHIPPLGELADTTASSDDEEGKNIFNDEEGGNEDTNVTEEEKELLQRTSESMSTEDDETIRKVALDDKDDEGEPLNEENDLSGQDLDVPGSEDDDENEEIGEEDEENNFYSRGQE